MSSIRDALRKAERERRRREGDEPREEARANPTPAAETSSGTPAREKSTERVQEPAGRLLPVLELPVGFTEELALFRRGVEAALPQASRTLLMSSATGQEGTTTVTSYLATSLALRDHRRTCLIDANFKSPQASRIFGAEGRRGLSDYCHGEVELEDILLPTASPDLVVMPIGTRRENASLALGQPRAQELAGVLAERFDYVLFDSGSVLGTAEASLLCQYVDGVVLVVRANRTKREVVAKADKIIRFNGGQLIGTVLNRRTFPIPEPIYKRL